MSNPVAIRLRNTIESWRPKLLDLGDSAIRCRRSEAGWSIAEVVGHLVDSACNNHQRFIRAQHSVGLEFPAYQQRQWVEAAGYQDFDWHSLVELWFFYNKLIATCIDNINESAMQTRCTIGSDQPCSLGFLVEDYHVHLLHHLSKIDERIND